MFPMASAEFQSKQTTPASESTPHGLGWQTGLQVSSLCVSSDSQDERTQASTKVLSAASAGAVG